MKAIISLIVLTMALLSSSALAEVPGLMSFQGTLTGDDGAGLDTTLSMVFTVYTDSAGGSVEWTETQPAVAVSQGIFNVLLGSVNAFSEDVFSAAERWLGVQVGGDAELTPRRRIAAAGYAFRAAGADTSDFARTAPVVSDGDWTVSGGDMYSAVSGDVGIGTSSPAARLHVNGDVRADSVYRIEQYQVLSTKGLDNTLVGKLAGLSNSGQYTTIVGYQAGWVNSGNDNTFVGKTSGYHNTAGASNTFLGMNSGNGNTTGNFNVYVGMMTASGCSTGSANTFLGSYAGAGHNSGSNNTFVGQGCGYCNRTGNNNTFLGLEAGKNNTDGSNNVFIGQRAGYNELGSNKLYIANGLDTNNVLLYGDFSTGRVGIGTLSPSAELHIDGAIRLGAGTRDFQIQEVDTSDAGGWSDLIDIGGIGIGSNDGNNRQMFMFNDGYPTDNIFTVATSENNGSTWEADFVILQNGRVGVGTGSPSRTLFVNGDAGGTTAWYNDSDGRLKNNVTPIEGALDKVDRLEGVYFEWKDADGRPTGKQVGLIAQQVAQVVPEVVEKKGEYYSLATASLVPVLIEAVKELKAENEEQRAEIEALRAEVRTLK